MNKYLICTTPANAENAPLTALPRNYDTVEDALANARAMARVNTVLHYIVVTPTHRARMVPNPVEVDLL
jgi:hypothetical protein